MTTARIFARVVALAWAFACVFVVAFCWAKAGFADETVDLWAIIFLEIAGVRIRSLRDDAANHFIAIAASAVLIFGKSCRNWWGTGKICGEDTCGQR